LISTTLRSHFLLNPDVVFLNHGSFGACPKPVFEAYQGWQRELEWQPVEFLGRRIESLLNDARAKISAYMGASADDLVFVPNATTGVNTIARSISLHPGDEILTTDHEYGACEFTWARVCQKAGAKLIRVPIDLPLTTPEAWVDSFWAHVTPRTRLIFVSHITSCSALTFPVEELCRRARAKGILTMIDGAHAVGQIPLNLNTLGADFYTSNFHKWLCAPKGSGFLYVRPEHQPSVEPLVTSWGMVEGGSFVKRMQAQPTSDPAAYLTVPAALEYQQQNDWDQVRADCHQLARDLRLKLADLLGTPPLAPDDRHPGDYAWFTQMIAAPLPPVDPKELKRRLLDEYQVEIPITTQPTVDGQVRIYVRASFQAYNTVADSARLLEGLKAILHL